MALVDTGKAIGAVTKVIQNRLRDYLLTLPTLTIGDVSVGPVSEVSVGKPEPPLNATNPRLNLFLYELQLDASLRNHALDEGQPPPLWLVLKYLLTTFDNQGNSDSVGAHILLGEGMRALQGLTFLPVGSTASILSALNDNPEPMKLTFDQAPSELLSKLMQGTDEKYRCSAAFEVRPVMIATGEPPAYSLLVGINYQTNAVIGEAGIHVDVTASMGSTIAAIVPEKFEANSTITIQGDDLNLENLAVQLGAATLTIVAQSPTTLQCQVNGTIAGGTALSAGGHPISVVQTLPSGRQRSSNLLVAYLLPTLTSVTASGLTRVNPPDSTSPVFGTVDLQGVLLGRDRDDVFVALYKDGETVRVFDEVVAVPPASTSQTHIRFQIKSTEAVPPGTYRVILRVNGQQALRSVEVTLVV